MKEPSDTIVIAARVDIRELAGLVEYSNKRAGTIVSELIHNQYKHLVENEGLPTVDNISQATMILRSVGLLMGRGNVRPLSLPSDMNLRGEPVTDNVPTQEEIEKAARAFIQMHKTNNEEVQ